jgi:uncharacterized protein (DUF1499 family)
MRIVSGLLQIILFVAVIGVALIVAGIIANRLPLLEPPGLMTRLSVYLNTNVAETTPDSSFPELQPRRSAAPPELLFDLARRAAQGLGWEITVLDAEKKEIQAIVTTKIWKFKDDVTITIKPTQPNGSELWIRSASRVGKGDLGANTRHILDLEMAVNVTAPDSARLITPQEIEQRQQPGVEQ